MGYMMAIGSCFGCSRIFSFNPVKVPSIRIEGEKRPVCEACINRANATRKAKGLPPHTIHPEAYTAASEDEV